MPLRLLTPFVEALPHVRALASLQLAEAVAFGSGSLKKSARDDVAAGWRRAVRQQTRRSRSAEELQLNAAASGIGFRRVPAPSPARDAVTGAAAGTGSPEPKSRRRRAS